MNRVGIIGAMDEELRTLKNAAAVKRTVTRAGTEFCEGILGGTEVVIVKCGIGKINAAVCTQILIDTFDVTAVINTGVAGSLSETLKIGDLVISEDAAQHDFDIVSLGFQKGEIPYTGLTAGDQFISSGSQKAAIVSDFGGLCCEMEGGAIAQVCWLNKVPFVIIRAISDSADEDSGVSFETFMEAAAKHCAAVVQEMITLPASQTL